MGAILILLTAGVLVADVHLAPWYPFLLILVVALASVACFETHGLLAGPLQPPLWLCYASVIALVVADWAPHVALFQGNVWHWLLGTFSAVVIAAFLVEMAQLSRAWRIGSARRRGRLDGRLPWSAAGVPGAAPLVGGRVAGQRYRPRHFGCGAGGICPEVCGHWCLFHRPFAGPAPHGACPQPQKTWEGAVGGVVASTLATVGINRLGPILEHGLWAEVGFGVSVGVAGILGDLAESFIKRDRGHKDASVAVPGFGGVLDVIDSVLFAVPVAYCWLANK